MAQGSGYVSMARPPHLEEVVDPGNEPLLRTEVLHQADRAPAGPLHTLLKPYSSAPRRRGGSDRSTAWGRRPLFVLSITNGLIAYSVFKIQKDRNTPKLVVYMELVEEEGREYAGLYIQNVGLVPALNVRIVADIEEWKEGQPVRSRFHERYEAFEDHHVTLKPQDHRLYELPWMEGWSLIVATVASCSNGPSDSTSFVLGDDRSALRGIAFGKSRKRAIKRTSAKSSGPSLYSLVK